MRIQTGVKRFIFLLMAGLLAACSSDDPAPAQDTAADASEMVESQAESTAADSTDAEMSETDRDWADDQVVDVITREYRIDMPDTLKMGWTTFNFSNEGGQAHFVILYRLAEGKTIDDQKAHVVPAFDALMEGLRSGELTKADIGSFMGENVPPWGFQMTYVGGAGLLSPGGQTQSTFFIDEPGVYLAECYVKGPDGNWHTSMGMLKQVNVLDEMGNTSRPAADVEITVGNDGVAAPDSIPAGEHTFKVEMLDDPENNFMPFDLNLARIDENTDLKELVFWMDWSNVGGLRAPAPVEFLGGVEHMNAGKFGYMTVDLEPGQYVWISEINAGEMHQAFVVEQADNF